MELPAAYTSLAHVVDGATDPVVTGHAVGIIRRASNAIGRVTRDTLCCLFPVTVIEGAIAASCPIADVTLCIIFAVVTWGSLLRMGWNATNPVLRVGRGAGADRFAIAVVGRAHAASSPIAAIVFCID